MATWPAAAMASGDVDRGHGDHDGDGQEIVVTGVLARDRADTLSGTTILAREDLERERRTTIGETLSRQAGVSATSFGPNASRPVLRGFQGERVRVLSDGIGSFDVSNTSVDHAVIVNPLTADRIEVLRGPSALLYGSSAIGGVVNVIDSRIPRSVPAEPLHIDLNATYGSAANERTAGVRVDVPLGAQWVAHLDGSYARSDDLDTGGFILAPGLRATAAASPEPDIAALADLNGALPNSGAETKDVAGGIAWVGANASFGVSVAHHDSLYGVPVRFSLDPAVEAEQVRIDARQTRIDWRGEYRPDSGILEAIRLRGGQADYRHQEIAEDGTVGTVFRSDGWETRLELVQRERGGWRGATGLQYLQRRVAIDGDEKFLPESRTEQVGLFTVQSVDLGAVRLEAGGRIEQSIARAAADIQLGNPDLRRRFTAVSGSLGASLGFAPGWRIGLNGAYSERAPSAEELFANGPHAGTQSFEIGNPDFGKERAKSVELTIHGSGTGYSLSASVHYARFSGFIFDSPDGTVLDDLPVYTYRQADARYWGAEIEGNLTLGTVGKTRLSAEALADVTRATIFGNGVASGPAPRIPALRLLGALEAKAPVVRGRIEVEHVDGQDRVAQFETPTAGYTMVNASIAAKPLGPDSGVELLLDVNNLFDAEARRHASILKDYAPLAGRDIRLTLKLSY